jgi:hypothetical protein
MESNLEKLKKEYPHVWQSYRVMNLKGLENCQKQVLENKFRELSIVMESLENLLNAGYPVTTNQAAKLAERFEMAAAMIRGEVTMAAELIQEKL